MCRCRTTGFQISHDEKKMIKNICRCDNTPIGIQIPIAVRDELREKIFLELGIALLFNLFLVDVFSVE